MSDTQSFPSWCSIFGARLLQQLIVTHLLLYAEHHVAHLSARDGLFQDASGASVELKGCNWFGFNVNDGTGMLTGLWGANNSGENALSMDFKTIVLRMKVLGFNTVRLPFSFQARLRCAHITLHLAKAVPHICGRPADTRRSQVPAIQSHVRCSNLAEVPRTCSQRMLSALISSHGSACMHIRAVVFNHLSWLVLCAHAKDGSPGSPSQALCLTEYCPALV